MQAYLMLNRPSIGFNPYVERWPWQKKVHAIQYGFILIVGLAWTLSAVLTRAWPQAHPGTQHTTGNWESVHNYVQTLLKKKKKNYSNAHTQVIEYVYVPLQNLVWPGYSNNTQYYFILLSRPLLKVLLRLWSPVWSHVLRCSHSEYLKKKPQKPTNRKGCPPPCGKWRPGWWGPINQQEA